MSIPAIPEDVSDGEGDVSTIVPAKLNASLYGSAKSVIDSSSSSSSSSSNGNIASGKKTSSVEEGKKRASSKKKAKKRRVGSRNGEKGFRKDTGDDLDGPPPTSFKVPRPKERLSDLAGIESTLKQVRELVQYPLLHPEIYDTLGIKPPRGVLLHGPPGCGKTMLANAIGGELGDSISFFRLSAPELVSWRSGDTERNIRALFQEAEEQEGGALIFIDEIDAIAGKRSGRSMDRRVVSQLLTAIDQCGTSSDDSNSSSSNSSEKGDEANDAADESKKRKRRKKGPVLVIGATSAPQDLDKSLRRAGRFDRELCVGVPDIHARRAIISRLTRNLSQSGRAKVDCESLAKRTPGYVGADLVALVSEAGILAVHRIFGQLYGGNDDAGGARKSSSARDDAMDADDDEVEEVHKSGSGADSSAVSPTTPRRLSPEQLARLHIDMSDFEDALKRVQPTAKREGFACVPNVSWDDVGSLRDIRQELILSIVKPIQEPEIFTKLGLNVPAGVLLYGPPGCGKTLLAKAIAAESEANFIAVKGPELLDKYVGESEKAVRTLFLRAQTSSPCIIFFDELDALAPRRSSQSGNGVSERVVNQLLTELDGLTSRRDVFIIGATNRPDILDPALLRPGRLDKLLYVPMPNEKARYDILRTLTRKTPLHVCSETEKDELLRTLAKHQRCAHFTGADLQALVREAALAALREALDSGEGGSGDVRVCPKHFEVALEKVKPSVSESDRASYEAIRKRIR
eukprot:g397.t1